VHFTNTAWPFRPGYLLCILVVTMAQHLLGNKWRIVWCICRCMICVGTWLTWFNACHQLQTLHDTLQPNYQQNNYC